MSPVDENFTVIVPDRHSGKRLDQVLARLCPQHSRARLQTWIRNGFVTVDGASLKQKDTVRGGQSIEVRAQITSHNETWTGQEIPIDVIHEDEAVLVVNKAPGIVVHPGAGNPDRTLVNALLYYCPELAQIPRAGIVHRLDKDTSGIMVVAKSLPAHTRLVRDLSERKITREYRAVVHGQLISGGTITAAIGRHPTQRTRMSVTDKGKHAVTHYRIVKKIPRLHGYQTKPGDGTHPSDTGPYGAPGQPRHRRPRLWREEALPEKTYRLRSGRRLPPFPGRPCIRCGWNCRTR